MNLDGLPDQSLWAGIGAAILVIAQRIKYFVVGDKTATQLAVMNTRLDSIERWQVSHTEADSAAVGRIEQEFKQVNEKLNLMLGREEARNGR